MSKFSPIFTLMLFVAAVFVVGACSSQAPGTKPDDMSAEEHEKHAEEHQELSDKHRDQYDPDATRVRNAQSDVDVNQDSLPVGVDQRDYSVEVYNPTERHRASAEQHQRHAAQHRDAAKKLMSYEEKQCASFPRETRSSCPLMGQVKAVEDIEGGVRITFHEGVPMRATVDHMRCHFAFARTEGYEGMNSCPLYLEGVSVEARDDDRSVILSTDESAAVEPLRERAREHVTP